jgi:predicted esterase
MPSTALLKTLPLKIFSSAVPAALVLHASGVWAVGILSEELVLNLPWVEYQERTYAARLDADDTSSLEFLLGPVAERSTPAPSGGLALADDDLNVDLPLVSFAGELYTARVLSTDSGRFRASDIAPFASPAGRGAIDTTELLAVKSPDQIAAEFGVAAFFGVELRYSVALLRLGFQTLDAFGNLSPASGLVAVPLEVPNGAPILSVQHGTIVARDDAPTADPAATGSDLAAYLMASSGYVVTVPDYPGFGDSSGLHPFVHAKTLAWSVIDLIRAARSLALANEFPLNGQLFLAGYSEGGYATMAAQREIETYHAAELPITASAPMAGPYDLSETMLQTALATDPLPNPSYFPYVLLAYNRIYGFADEDGDLFTPDFADTVPALFDGSLDTDAINASLPSIVAEIFPEELRTALESGGYHPVRAALQENDLYRWVPSSTTRLYHCEGDNVVPFANATRAYDFFSAAGAPVELVALSFGDHEACALPAIFLAKSWFDSMADLP